MLRRGIQNSKRGLSLCGLVLMKPHQGPKVLPGKCLRPLTVYGCLLMVKAGVSRPVLHWLVRAGGAGGECRCSVFLSPLQHNAFHSRPFRGKALLPEFLLTRRPSLFLKKTNKPLRETANRAGHQGALNQRKF